MDVYVLQVKIGSDWEVHEVFTSEAYADVVASRYPQPTRITRQLVIETAPQA